MITKHKIFYAEANYGKNEINAVLKVLSKQRHSLMGGNQTLILENKIKKLFNMKFGLMTNSGSSSNLLAPLRLSSRLRQPKRIIFLS